MPLRSFSDGELFAETYGEGAPRVLALHGWGRRGSDFSVALSGIPAIAVDLPGFGASPAPSHVIGARGYAEIVGRVLDGFDRPPVVVGHSFGGRVAICLAAASPGAVGELLLTGVPLVRAAAGRKPSPGYRLARWLNQIGVVTDARMEDIRRSRGSADYRAVTGLMRDILVRVVNESYEVQLGEVEGRVLLLWGEEDTEVPLAVARDAASFLSRGGAAVEVRVLEGVGHHTPLEAPQALRRAVLEALERSG